MLKVYTLRHTIVRDGEELQKEIGTYTSEELANLRVRQVPQAWNILIRGPAKAFA